eukprot:g10658.t1
MAGSEHDLLLLVCGTLIFFTYIGFLLLEVGKLPSIYLAAIVRKRILAMAICVAVYTLLGYELANSKSENATTLPSCTVRQETHDMLPTISLTGYGCFGGHSGHAGFHGVCSSTPSSSSGHAGPGWERRHQPHCRCGCGDVFAHGGQACGGCGRGQERGGGRQPGQPHLHHHRCRLPLRLFRLVRPDWRLRSRQRGDADARVSQYAGVMSRFAAAGLGVICAFLYALFVRIWAKVGVDDVTGSVVVHAGGGLVGLVFAALFAPGLQDSRGPLLAAQLVGSLAITGWVAATTFCMCVLVDCVFYLRVPFEEEIGVQSRDLDLVRAYTLPLPEEQDSQDVLRRLTGFMGCLAKKQMERKMLFLLAVLYYKRRVSNMSHHNGRTETHAYLIKLARTLYLAYFDQPEQVGLSRTSQMALAKELSKQQRRGLVDLDLAVIFDECALLIESELNPHRLQYQQLLQE